MIRLRPSGVDEILIKRVQDWYEPGPGVFITSTSTLFSPAMLFTGTTTGVWYDPSDFTTLFQNAAGTQPVTAVEQPVGRMLDKSGRGNHAFNPSGNSANFPVLSARYNLLTKTEQFDDAVVWERSNGANGSAPVVTADYEAGPFAGTLADRVQLARTTDSNSFSQLSTLMTSALTNGVTYIASVWMKSRSGSVVVDMGSFNGAYGSYKPTVTTEWQRFSYQWTVSTAASRFGPLLFQATGTALTADLLIWGADLRVANDALNQPAYQRVNTSTDYDTVGFKPYLRFNGTNQYLQTNSIDFTYGDKMFVSAGVRKLSDTAATIVEQLDAGSNVQFTLLSAATQIRAGSYRVSAIGTYGSLGTADPSPKTSVQSMTYSSTGTTATNFVSGRYNGAAVAYSAEQFYGASSTDVFNNTSLYIGARAGTSLWFNGRLYGMVVAGKLANAVEITETEKYINQKTGAF